MGNNTEKPPLPSQLQQSTDSRYGGTIWLDKNKTKAYQIVDLDHASVEYFSKLLNTRKELQHTNLVNINRMWIDDYRQNCSFQKMHRVTMEYLYIPQCLQDEIKRYCDLSRPVPEVLVRRYFSGVVSCLEYLRSKGTCHGDVKPKNILISKDKNAYLADSFFMNSGRIAFQIVMQDPQSLSLLSPTQLQSLRNKKFVSLKQIHQDQIFAIGLSMMETMTAQPAMECYDLANLKLKPQFFNRKYSQMLACDYSPQLCQLVMSCVDFIPENRIKFQQFIQTINGGFVNNHPVHTANAVYNPHYMNAPNPITMPNGAINPNMPPTPIASQLPQQAPLPGQIKTPQSIHTNINPGLNTNLNLNGNKLINPTNQISGLTSPNNVSRVVQFGVPSSSTHNLMIGQNLPVNGNMVQIR